MTIEIGDLTNGSTGAFDELMAAADALLLVQYNANRITGADYASVYLGTIQTAMEQGLNFLSVQNQVALIEAQTENEEAKIILTNAQTANIKSQAAQDSALKAAQTELVNAQIITEGKNTLFTNQKYISEYLNTGNATPLGTAAAGSVGAASIAKTTAEGLLLTQKRLTEIEQTIAITNQAALYNQQSVGFIQKTAHDSFATMSSIWQVAKSAGDVLELPSSTSSVGTLNKRLWDIMEEIYNNSESSNPTYDVD